MTEDDRWLKANLPQVPRKLNNGNILAFPASSVGPDGEIVDGLVEIEPGDPRYGSLMAEIRARS